MRHLPRKRTKRHKLIIKIVKDYFGLGASLEDKKSIKKLSLWIMGRRKGLRRLTEEERDALWNIRQNMKDVVYVKGLS